MKVLSVPLVDCGSQVKLRRFTVSTWTGISVRTGERRTAEEGLTGCGILLSKIGWTMRRFQILMKEVLCSHIMLLIFIIQVSQPFPQSPK